MAIAGALAGRLGKATLDLLFPPRCAGCGADGSFLCDACAGTLQVAAPPRCARCWRPGVEGTCAHCRSAAPAFDSLFAAYVYTGLARDLVHQLKYRGMTALAGPMALLLAAQLGGRGAGADLIVPVPLSGLRGRTRGYNQAQTLARGLSGELGVPLARRALERRRHTSPQARSADAETRRRNVEGAFGARERAVAGRRVLLIDDVTTTGATLSACATALKAAGAPWVGAVAFARED